MALATADRHRITEVLIALWVIAVIDIFVVILLTIDNLIDAVNSVLEVVIVLDVDALMLDGEQSLAHKCEPVALLFVLLVGGYVEAEPK